MDIFDRIKLQGPVTKADQSRIKAGRHEVHIDYQSGEEGVLLCPQCGNEYLHQGAVTVCARDGENKDGTQVDVRSSGEIVTRRIKSVSFEGRRDDMRTSFECEGCDAVLSLVLSQHKGRTFVRWDVSEPSKGR
jgi:uncharacterized OB-fold protein